MTYGASAQNISLYGGSAQNYSLGNATIAASNSHSALNNQAGILAVDKWGFTAGAINLFGLPSLNLLSASGIYKFNERNAVSISVKHLGDSDLNTQVIGVAYARKLSKSWNLSLQGDLLSFQAKNFGSRLVPTVEIGSVYDVNKKVHVGFHLFNPFGQALTAQEDISAIFRTGVLYNLSPKVALSGEIEKDIILDFRVKVGIDYTPIDNLHIRAGFTTQEAQFSFGLAYTFGKYTVHGVAAVHPVLGVSTGGEISYQN